MCTHLYHIPLDYIAQISLATASAMNYNVDQINGKKRLYLPEINNVIPSNSGKKDSPAEKTLKLLGEGKPAELIVPRGNKVKTFIIQPIPVCYTRAFENAYDIRPELRRRFVVVETHSTTESIENYHMARNNGRHTLFTDNSKEKKLADMIRNHFTSLVDLEGVETFDPFSDYLFNIIPKTEKSKCYLDQYYNMLDACAKWNFAKRMKFKLRKKIDGHFVEKMALFLNLEDHYTIHKVFHEQFVNSLRKYEDDEFLDEIDKLPQQINWQEYMDCGYREMQNNSQMKLITKKDPDFIDKWYANQLTGTSVQTVDYMTGDPETITDI